DRIEVTNPGNSLIEVDRIIDDRRSRNEQLAMSITLLHGSVAGRSRPPAFAFMRDEGTLAALARACGLARRQQWPPRSSAALWSVSAARHRSLACSGRYRPPPTHANCNQIPATSPCG